MSDRLDPHTLRELARLWPKLNYDGEARRLGSAEDVYNRALALFEHPDKMVPLAPPETGHPERLCVNCGRTARVQRGDVLPECVGPDGMAACTFDMTDAEAAQHWRQKWHDHRADVARLTEQVREWRAEAEAAGDRARAEAALRREIEAERDASLATATEAAETVARLTAALRTKTGHIRS